LPPPPPKLSSILGIDRAEWFASGILLVSPGTWNLLLKGNSMSFRQIVFAYVRLKNRPALEDMRIHRRQLLDDVRSRAGVDPGPSVLALQEDVKLIEAGLAQIGQG
jgi:hypothetical protein